MKGSARPSRRRGARAGALALLSVLLGAGRAEALRPALRTYGVADGLKYSQVFCVAEDRDGMIWAGTSYGVSRYDGRRFSSLTSREGLPHDSVSALAVTADGTVWAATQEGLARIAPAAGPLGEPRVVPLAPGAREPGFKPLHLVASGDDLWAGDGSRVELLSGGKLRPVPLPDGFGPRVAALGPAEADGCWAGSAAGLARLSPTGGAKVLPLPPELGAPVSIARDGEGLVVLLRSALARLDGEGRLADLLARIPTGAEPNGLARLGDGWAVATEAAGLLLVRDGREPEWIGPAEGLPAATISGAAVDRNGILWLASEAGLVKVFDLDLRSIPSRLPELGGMVFAAAPGPEGRIWVGHTEGLSEVEGGRIRRVPLAAADAAVWALLPLPGGELLAGTPRGLVHVSAGGARPLPELPVAGRRRVFGLAREKDGTIWATTIDGIVRFRWDERARAPVDAVPVRDVGGEPVGEARAIAPGADGGLWIGTDGKGLLHREAGRFRRVGGESGLPTPYCRVVLETAKGLLVGTDRGLFRLEGGRARPIESVNRFLDDPWVAALAEAGGAVWLATSYSVFRIVDDVVVEKLDHASGLVGASTTAEGGLAPLPDGRIAVGMEGGLSFVDASRSRRGPPPPAVAVSGAVDGDGRPLPPGRRVPFDAATVTFAFRSPTFFSEERTLFSERLLPLESDFSPPHSEARARYSGLDPGSYTLEVRALAASGLRSPRPARFHFAVAPPWWGTPWARGGIALLLAAVVGFVVRLRTRSLRRRAAELEERVQERTRELSEANRRLEQAQARIAQLLETRADAQLDPSAWAETVGPELARALGVDAVGVFSFDEDGTVNRLSGSGVIAPRPADAEESEAGAFLPPGAGALFPARGASGELLGAVVVPEGAAWDEVRRRLVAGFAHQLGGALEIRRVRSRLADAESARDSARAAMERKGVVPAAVCRACRRVVAGSNRCPDDGTLLDPQLLPSVVRDRYRLVQLLGEGGMGTVFAAKDLRLPREVAIKIVRPDRMADAGMRPRFLREAGTLARLSHPGVTSLFDVGELPDGALFLVMERLRGRDLGSLLAAEGRGAPVEVAEVARQASAALAAAHRAGVVHRDVKPENLVLSLERGRLLVKVVDFGLAREASQERGLTRTGMIVGTPAYMAPEQVAGEEVSAATDLYGLAAVLWEALTGVRLVRADAVGAIFSEILTSPPEAPSLHRPGLPAEVDAELLAALAKSPAGRPADLEEWGRRLAARLEELPADEPGWRGGLLAEA